MAVSANLLRDQSDQVYQLPMCFVLNQIGIFFLVFFPMVIGPWSALPQFSVTYFTYKAGCQDSGSRQRPAFAARLENNNGRLRMVVTNDTQQEFRGTARVSLGNDAEQKEIGQFSLVLPPQEISLLNLNGVNPAGNHYSLAIYDLRGARLFFRIAPLRAVSDSTPAISVNLTPIQHQRSKSETLSMVEKRSTSTAPVLNSSDEFAHIASQVQVQPRLLANEDANDSFILSLELRAQRPVYNANMAIVAGKTKDQKPVSINLLSQVEFKLPNQFDSEKISYKLTGKDGKVLSQGDLEMQQLMVYDSVMVRDIRTDRSAYNPGETAVVTILLEGGSRAGYRLEVSSRENQKQSFFQDQKTARANTVSNSTEFRIPIPNSATTLIIFEFRIFDLESGLLFDSGEREIPISGEKQSLRQ